MTALMIWVMVKTSPLLGRLPDSLERGKWPPTWLSDLDYDRYDESLWPAMTCCVAMVPSAVSIALSMARP